MSSLKGLGVACLLAYAVGLTAYLVRATHHEGTQPSVPSEVLANTVHTPSALPELESPDQRMRSVVDAPSSSLVTPPGSPSPLTVPEAFGELDKALFQTVPVFDGTDACFRKKYDGLNAAQLKVAFSAVEGRRNSERKRIVDERMRAGQFEEHFLPQGEKFPIASSKDGTPVSFGFVSDALDGYQLLKTTSISAEEYPEFRVLELEGWWLHNQLHKVGACDCKSR